MDSPARRLPNPCPRGHHIWYYMEFSAVQKAAKHFSKEEEVAYCPVCDELFPLPKDD